MTTNLENIEKSLLNTWEKTENQDEEITLYDYSRRAKEDIREY